MVEKKSISTSIFVICNYTFLLSMAILCLIPLIHTLAISFSSNVAVVSSQVILWPVDFTLDSYDYVLKNNQFTQSLLITMKRVALGIIINMFLTMLIAYPLSKEAKSFKWRTVYAWVFVFTMLFSGGLIPVYMVVRATGLLDSIWALILPGAVPVFNVVLLLNFFRGLPKELEEAAFIDGAGHWVTLWKVYVPLSVPALVTVGLFVIVGHWNSWFDGIIYMNSSENYPLQSYLRTVVVERSMSSISFSDIQKEVGRINDRTLKAAQIFLAALPILILYPFLQKYFMKGIVLGSVKG
ncbi:MAG TPA: carbohydrate ABC transporter permease [Bacilli bacterium]